MSIFRSAKAATSPEIVGFALRLKRMRTGSVFENTAHDGNLEGKMRRFGMERIEVIASPEFCMARMIKALVCHDRTIGRTRPLCTDEETVASDEDIERLQRVIGYLEYKVFGNNAGENYPEFESLSRWIHWRLCLHFPGHSLVSRTGWTPAFVDGGIRDGVNFLSPFE